MAIFGKTDKEEKTTKKAAKADVLDMVETPKEEKAEKKVSKPSKTNTGDAYKILTRPIVSEKSFKQVSMGKYTFKVNPSANKISIAKAIEKVYDVKVVRVNIVRTQGKRKTSGRINGRTSATKKAIVTLKAGQQIS